MELDQMGPFAELNPEILIRPNALSQTIKEKFEPPLIAQIELENIRSKQVMVLTAKRSLQIPYYEFDGRAWVRQGTESRKLSLTEKQQLLQGIRIVPASVDISFHKIQLEPEVHKYSLLVAILLKVPPMQRQWRLNLLWPTSVEILKLKGLSRGEYKTIKRCKYIEIIRGDMKRPIFPGDSLLVIGPGKESELEYIYDDIICDRMTDQQVDLYYRLYLENHSAVEGSVPFDKLNVF